MQANAESTAG